MEQKLYNALCKFMELQTKDCVWYYDTPEQRFEYTPESLWLINPKTGHWVLELGKSGRLWWYWDFYFNFQTYFNMEQSDFEKFIKIWVEDVLNRGVSTAKGLCGKSQTRVEDVLNRGVSTAPSSPYPDQSKVEDVLNRGVSTASFALSTHFCRVEDVLNRGVSTAQERLGRHCYWVEDVLNRGKTIQ